MADLHLAIATAYLGGGLLMAVFREELPAVNRTRLGWFVAGAASMTSLLLLALTQAAH